MFCIITNIAGAIKTRSMPFGHLPLAWRTGGRAAFTSGLIGLILPFTATCALAGEFVIATNPPVGQGTCTTVLIRGFNNENFDVTWTDAAGVSHTTKTTLVNPTGGTQGFAKPCVDAATKTEIKVKNTSQPSEPVQDTASLASLDPPSNTAVTVLAIDPGLSTVTVAGNIFTLSGGYETIASSVDHDRLSPGFGSLGGIIPASSFSVFGSGAAGNIQIGLNAAIPWMVDVGALWGVADVPSTGISVPFVLELIGTLSFGTISSDVIGSLTGNVTFLDDNWETISGNLDLVSAFGPISGRFSSAGQAMLVSEPPTLLLVVVASAALAYLRAAGRRQPRQQKALPLQRRPVDTEVAKNSSVPE